MARQPTIRLTPRRIESLKPEAKTYRVTDASAPLGGLLLEVRPTGGKSWISRVSVAGGYKPNATGQLQKCRARRVDVTLGKWPLMDMESAHDAHRQNAALAADGKDPRAEKHARRLAPLFNELMAGWLNHLKQHKAMTSRTLDAHHRRHRLHLYRLDSLPVDQLTRAIIAPVLTRVAEKTPAQSRACLITLRSALDWAVQQGWLEENPAAGMKAHAYGAGPAKPRDVVLTLGELRELWQAVTDSRMDPWIKDALRLLVLTGARRDEVAGMRIEELDLASHAWHLPAERAKTSTARTIYLSSMAVEMLQMRISGRSAGPVLLGRNSDGIHSDSLTTAISRLRRGKLKTLGQQKPFTVHDLRRSAATAWGEHLDARPELIDRMLGHARRNPIEAAYQHQTYERQQRHIIEAWGALVLDHVASKPGDNVTPLRRQDHFRKGVAP